MLLLYTEFSGNVHCTYIVYFPPNLKIIYELKWIYSIYGHQFQMRIYIYFYIVIHIFYNKIIIYTGISLLILASLLWMFLIFFRLGNHMNLLLIKIKHARWVWTKGIITMCKSKKNRKHNGQKKKGQPTITGAWGMDFVSSSPLFSTTPPFFKIFI